MEYRHMELWRDQHGRFCVFEWLNPTDDRPSWGMRTNDLVEAKEAFERLAHDLYFSCRLPQGFDGIEDMRLFWAAMDGELIAETTTE